MGVSLTTLLLSRIQFGFTIGFHILFPTLNIGLAIFISIFEALWLKTHKIEYLKICKYWTKIFALTFGMGVVSGIVLSYELGTNFGNFTAAAGEVLGPLFAYEVLSAFFLEAGFLGIMLFGWKRVNPKIHYTATLLVTIGTIISAFWIMSANSWMQTPSGYFEVGNKFVVQSWLNVVFNPSFVHRLIHMLLASLVTTCFVIAGISSWYLLKKRYYDIAKPCLSIAMGLAVIVAPLQLVVGDLVGTIVYRYQPLKTAAIEGNWNTQQGAPLILFAIPDVQNATNHFEIAIPYGASLFNTHSLYGTLVGLKSVSPNNWPLVATTFFSFRVMVGIGLLFIAIAFYGLWLRFRQKLYTNNFFLRLCILASPLGFIAVIAGWLTAESGRQPWVIYGLMRTADGVSAVPMLQVLISLSLFVLTYGIIFSFYLYYLFKIIRKEPLKLEEPLVTLGYIPHPKGEELD
jgi:cytochrome bd ubiquinol oxidase subunit I